MLHLVSTTTSSSRDKMPVEVDEYALLQRIVEGDALAFETLYKL